MIIAERLRTSNRAEYILYMWQVEDLLRSYHLDFDELRSSYLSRFQLPEEQSRQTERWYADLCRMMQEEGLRHCGHLQITKNALADMEELHRSLLQSSKFPYYHDLYNRVLPYIVELRAKAKKFSEDGEKTVSSELETCFNALYGVLLLRMQGKDISTETEQATKEIGMLLGQLSDYYLQNEKEPLEL